MGVSERQGEQLTLAGSLGQQLAEGAAPVNGPAAGYWLLFAVLGFVVGQLVATVFLELAALATGNGSHLADIAHLSEPPTWYVVSSLVGLWVGFTGSAWVATRVKGTGHFRRDLGLRFRLVDLFGLPIGVASQYVVALLYVPISQHVSHFNEKFNAPSQRLTGSSHGANFWLIAVLTVVGAPLVEELFFRGLLLRGLARALEGLGGVLGPVLAVLVTGLLFGLAHAESLQLLGLALFGVLLSALAFRTGRLGMSVLAHLSFNLVAVSAVVLPHGLAA